MPGSNRKNPCAVVYEIKIRGSLDESWSDWFSGMAILSDQMGLESRVTTLRGEIADQSALRGILTRLWDMNYEVISFQKIPLLIHEEEKDE